MVLNDGTAGDNEMELGRKAAPLKSRKTKNKTKSGMALSICCLCIGSGFEDTREEVRDALESGLWRG
jgi:hypothetical protein